jgi:hypothetical protein
MTRAGHRADGKTRKNEPADSLGEPAGFSFRGV